MSGYEDHGHAISPLPAVAVAEDSASGITCPSAASGDQQSTKLMVSEPVESGLSLKFCVKRSWTIRASQHEDGHYLKARIPRYKALNREERAQNLYEMLLPLIAQLKPANESLDSKAEVFLSTKEMRYKINML